MRADDHAIYWEQRETARHEVWKPIWDWLLGR